MDTLVFDKTGTLTQGAPALRSFLAVDAVHSLSFEDSLKLASSAEQYTTHPLGLVLVEESKRMNLALQPVKSHKVYPGMGIVAQVRGRRLREEC